jgi:hypothetical protein
MKTEKITRSEATKTRASNYMVVLTADEGKKIVSQDYLDYLDGNYEGEGTPNPSVCCKVYLGCDDSALNYAEVDEATATAYQEAYDKEQEEAMFPEEQPEETEEGSK